MKALLLNAGRGVRMGDLTQELPKCLVDLGNGNTGLYYQLKAIKETGIKKVVIATGFQAEKIQEYAEENFPDLSFEYAHNDIYMSTNHIYSSYLASKLIDEEIFLVHGDMVFETKVLDKLLNDKNDNCAIISSTVAYSEKDFRCLISDGLIRQISIYADSRLMIQPLYKLCKRDWDKWKENMAAFCESGNTNVYVEESLNPLLEKDIALSYIDILDDICYEFDNKEDLEFIKNIIATNKRIDLQQS